MSTCDGQWYIGLITDNRLSNTPSYLKFGIQNIFLSLSGQVLPITKRGSCHQLEIDNFRLITLDIYRRKFIVRFRQFTLYCRITGEESTSDLMQSRILTRQIQTKSPQPSCHSRVFILMWGLSVTNTERSQFTALTLCSHSATGETDLSPLPCCWRSDSWQAKSVRTASWIPLTLSHCHSLPTKHSY